MADFSLAINLIRKYEGYAEKAYPHPNSGEEPYSIGYGTQFYPDGAPVKKGQRCTKEKALEYLFNEVFFTTKFFNSIYKEYEFLYHFAKGLMPRLFLVDD